VAAGLVSVLVVEDDVLSELLEGLAEVLPLSDPEDFFA
jgi:hypothetical protein